MSLARRTLVVASLAVVLSAVASPALGVVVRTIGTFSNDLVFNPRDGFLYASISPVDTQHPNEVVRIDPRTAAIVASVAVGDQPGRLALADDGNTLYVGLDGPGAVRRVDLPSMTAGDLIDLGTADGLYAEDLEVQPGHPGVIAVALAHRGFTPRHVSVTIFDQGIPRPVTTFPDRSSNRITFGAPDRVYGYDDETTEHGFRRMVVHDDGIEVLDVTRNLFTDFTPDIRFFGGRVYSATGQVVDGEALARVGTFTLPLFASGGPPVVTPDRVYFVDMAFFSVTNVVLGIHDPASLGLIQQYQIPGVQGRPNSLQLCGPNRLAFRTITPSAIHVLDRVNEPPSCDLSLRMTDSPDPAQVGDVVQYLVTIANRGEQPADHTIFRDQLPVSFEFDSYSSPRGACYDSLGTIVCDFGPTAPADSFDVVISAKTTAPGLFFNRAVVLSYNPDADSTNNVGFETTTVLASPDVLIAQLIETLDFLGLPAGPRHALSAPLEQARRALNAGDLDGACEGVDRFEARVRQPWDRLLGADPTAQLLRLSARIRVALHCGGAGPRRRAERQSEEGIASRVPAALELAARSDGASPRFAVAMPEAGDARLEVLDVQGRVVAILFEGALAAGVREFRWNAAGGMPSGLYFCRLTAFGQRRVAKASLLR